MTTTNGMVARLLARATEYEQRAAGLRLAAEEFTGELVNGKKNGMHRQLAAASELRIEQKGEPSEPAASDGLSQPERKQLRQEIIVKYLEGAGPQRTADVMRELHRRGHVISKDRTRQILHEMTTVTQQTIDGWPRWIPLTASPAIAGILKRSKKQKRTRRSIIDARLEKAKVILTILKEADSSLSTSELAAAARKRGLVEITGTHNYAKRGWIKVTKRNGVTRYSFVKMPPAEGESPTTTE